MFLRELIILPKKLQIWPGVACNDSNPYIIFQAFESAGIGSSGEYRTARKRVDITPACFQGGQERTFQRRNQGPEKMMDKGVPAEYLEMPGGLLTELAANHDRAVTLLEPSRTKACRGQWLLGAPVLPFPEWKFVL